MASTPKNSPGSRNRPPHHPMTTSHSHSRLLLLLPFLLSSLTTTYATTTTTTTALDPHLSYNTYPNRKSSEAAVIEWGNSALITAIDAAVATFGPQTSRGAFFEVETTPLLAQPIDGGTLPFSNAADMVGNMVIMTNSHPDLTPVEMALAVQDAGGAALAIVNTEETNGTNSQDYIYAARVEDGEEEMASKVDIPVIMISLPSGNQITQTGDNHDELPERVRLYSSDDRPFFEDVSADPVIYLIHHVLEDGECDDLVREGRGVRMETMDKGGNLLEGYDASRGEGVVGATGAYLWKGPLVKGPKMKAMDERFEQVTGFPRDQFSDFELLKFERGGMQGLHYDALPVAGKTPIVSMIVFLNEWDDDEGGEIVFPDAEGNPIKIKPRKGMAVVYQNWSEENGLNMRSKHGDLMFTGNEKWIARRWIYTTPVSNTRKYVLPLLALPFGGYLPRVIVALHDAMLNKFGFDDGSMYFDKLVMALSVFILLSVLQVLMTMIQKGIFGTDSGKMKKKVKTDKQKKRD